MGVKKLDRRLADRYQLPEKEAQGGRIAKGFPVHPRRIERAEIFDVSETGIGFLISSDRAPLIGELVAIEFSLPGFQRMAWYAQVVRVEMVHSSHDTDFASLLKVGAKFLLLPVKRRKQLKMHIDILIDEANKSDDRVSVFSGALRVQRSYENSIWRYAQMAVLVGVSLVMAVWFVTYMMSIGSPSLRGQGPPIWPGYEENKPDQTPPDPKFLDQ